MFNSEIECTFFHCCEPRVKPMKLFIEAEKLLVCFDPFLFAWFQTIHGPFPKDSSGEPSRPDTTLNPSIVHRQPSDHGVLTLVIGVNAHQVRGLLIIEHVSQGFVLSIAPAVEACHQTATH